MTGTRILISILFLDMLWTPFFLMFIRMRKIKHGTPSASDRLIAGLPWLASVPISLIGLVLVLSGI